MTDTVVLLGLIDSEFIRLGVLWGYSAQYAEHEQNLTPPAADTTLTFSTVPAGEVWRILSFTAWTPSSTVEVIRLQAIIGGTTHYIMVAPHNTAHLTIAMQGQVLLTEDDYLTVLFEGPAAGADLYADAFGYKMAVI